MSDGDLCLHCQTQVALARWVEAEKRKNEERRALMSDLDRYLDEELERLVKDAQGQAFHQLMWDEYYAPAGSPDASVGYVIPNLCYCEDKQE